jgi:SH3-like domain-containing protein
MNSERRALILMIGAFALSARSVGAEDARTGESQLPIPRFVSLKANEGNARRGPSTSNRIDWVFTRRGMPLQVTAEYGHWRRVRDHDGAGGWVHYTLLSGTRNVIFEDPQPLRLRPADDAAIVAQVEVGVIGRLGSCEPDWCKISAGGYSGWVRKTAVWGVDPGEIRS